MSKGKKWTYEEVYNYFKEHRCELLTPKEEYINIKQLLDFICSCNNHDKVRFVKFKDRDQRCKLCGKKKLSNAKSYTYEEVKIFVENLGYELISKDYKSSHKLVLKDNDGYYYTITYGNLLTGFKPSKFHKYNPYTIQNIKLWCKLNNKPFELISKEYINNNEKLKWQCLKSECLDIFQANWRDIHTGNGCGVCQGLQITLSNCLATKNPELAKEWHITLNGNLTPYDITSKSHSPVWWQCGNDINHIWNTSPANRSNGSNGNNTGCPICNESKGEKECKKIFDSRNEYYIHQKEFEFLIGLGGGNLSYDFYLPQYNLLVEYQGEFHDGTAYQQTEEEFKIQQEHDKRKKEYAQINNIKLLEIWYWDFDRIEEILDRELNKFV